MNLPTYVAAGGGVGDHAQAAFGGQLDEGADRAGQAEDLQARARILAGLEDFRGGLAFGKRQRVLDDHRAAQRHREQHAEQAAEAGDRQHPGIAEILPVAEDDQRRDREDHARGDRRTGRGAGLHDVVFQDRSAAEQAQYAHRHDGGRDRGRDGQAGEQAEVGVRRGEDHREDDGEDHGARRELRDGLGRDGLGIHALPLAGDDRANSTARSAAVSKHKPRRASRGGRPYARAGAPPRGELRDNPAMKTGRAAA